MKQVVSERCPLCGGHKQPGKTTYSVDLGSGVILVRNVPATVCVQCGEAWIEHHWCHGQVAQDLICPIPGQQFVRCHETHTHSRPSPELVVL